MEVGIRRGETFAACALDARERRQEVDRGAGACDAFVVLRSGLRTLGRGVRCRRELHEREDVEQLAPREEEAGVRAVELVRGACEEVASDLPYVDQLVRREVHRVDEE